MNILLPTLITQMTEAQAGYKLAHYYGFATQSCKLKILSSSLICHTLLSNLKTEIKGIILSNPLKMYLLFKVNKPVYIASRTYQFC